MSVSIMFVEQRSICFIVRDDKSGAHCKAAGLMQTVERRKIWHSETRGARGTGRNHVSIEAFEKRIRVGDTL